MYCDKCHHDYQPIYCDVDRGIRRFIKANRKWIDKIKDGEIFQINGRNKITIRKATHHIYNLNILEEPYGVRYIGVRDHGEGSMIELLDSAMDKIYSYYDVM